MKIIILGQVGSGKGTYASRVSKKLGIPYISTGELLRQEIKDETELGKRSKIYVEKADWSAQEIHDIVMELMKRRISQPDAENGFIFDGFPRTMKQAEDLEKITDIDVVINLVVPHEVLIRRITSRRTCKHCGEIYSLLHFKPKVEGKCDKCGGEIYQRKDDSEEMTKIRMAENDKYTKPVIEFYRKKGKVIDVEWDEKDVPEGDQDVPVETMVNKILNILENK